MLWLLENIRGANYDEHDGFVIRADTSAKARALAVETSKNKLWGDPKFASCDFLDGLGPDCVILEDKRSS